MDYNKLIETISTIVNTDTIYKQNLSLVYELPEDLLRRMDEELYYKTNKGGELEYKDEIEINVMGVKIKLIKKPNNS
jgi:hypothetical protein